MLGLRTAINEGVKEGVESGLDSVMGDVIRRIVRETLAAIKPDIEKLKAENAALREELRKARGITS